MISHKPIPMNSHPDLQIRGHYRNLPHTLISPTSLAHPELHFRLFFWKWETRLSNLSPKSRSLVWVWVNYLTFWIGIRIDAFGTGPAIWEFGSGLGDGRYGLLYRELVLGMEWKRGGRFCACRYMIICDVGYVYSCR